MFFPRVSAVTQGTPNVTKILKQIGVPKCLWKRTAEPTSLTVHRYSGMTLASDAEFDEKIHLKYGAPLVDLHGDDLLEDIATIKLKQGMMKRLAIRK